MKAAVCFLFLVSCILVANASRGRHRCPRYKVRFFIKTSRSASGLNGIVRRFQAALGGRNNMNRKGPIADGFRQINWDAAAVPFDMPFDFFNTNVPRGALFFAKDNKFAVSNPAEPPPDDFRFSSLNRVGSRDFIPFSRERLFTPVRRNKLDAVFRIPGSNRKAAVSGYGAVFVDVDRRYTTFITFFDKRGCRIARIAVPPQNKGLSFAGIVVRRRKAVIAKVSYKLGNTRIIKRGRDSKRTDFVVLDDLIYGEPQKLW